MQFAILFFLLLFFRGGGGVGMISETDESPKKDPHLSIQIMLIYYIQIYTPFNNLLKFLLKYIHFFQRIKHLKYVSWRAGSTSGLFLNVAGYPLSSNELIINSYIYTYSSKTGHLELL